MIKKLLSIFLLMVPLYNCQVTNNLNCLTLSDIQTKGYTYLNDNVYDITGYDHPGGLNKLNQCKGQSLTTFFNSYKVHLNSNHVNRDLSKLFVGKLYTSCVTEPPPTVLPPTVLPPTVLPTTVLPTTVLPTTVPKPPTTQLITTQAITTNKLSTTSKPIMTPITGMITKPAISNTSNIINPKLKLQIFGIIMIIFLMI